MHTGQHPVHSESALSPLPTLKSGHGGGSQTPRVFGGSLATFLGVFRSLLLGVGRRGSLAALFKTLVWKLWKAP